jgi:hypothetical protein
MKVISEKNESRRIKKIQALIKSAGNRIFAVSFIKRSDGTYKKMTCRRHVSKPQYAKIPSSKNKKSYDPKKYNLITVFDVNSLQYNSKNRICGRGSWKSIPLDSIKRIKVGGEIYKIIF